MGAWPAWPMTWDLTEDQRLRLVGVLAEVPGEIDGQGAEIDPRYEVIGPEGGLGPTLTRCIPSTVARLWLLHHHQQGEFRIRLGSGSGPAEEMFLGGRWTKNTQGRPSL